MASCSSDRQVWLLVLGPLCSCMHIPPLSTHSYQSFGDKIARIHIFAILEQKENFFQFNFSLIFLQRNYVSTLLPLLLTLASILIISGDAFMIRYLLVVPGQSVTKLTGLWWSHFFLSFFFFAIFSVSQKCYTITNKVLMSSL